MQWNWSQSGTSHVPAIIVVTGIVYLGGAFENDSAPTRDNLVVCSLMVECAFACVWRPVYKAWVCSDIFGCHSGGSNIRET